MAWLNNFVAEWGNLFQFNVTRAWANVNEERRRESYWFVNQGPGVAPMMSRYVTRFFYKAFSFEVLQVELLTSVVGAGVYDASSGLNILGQKIDFEVRDHVTAHPIFGTRGVGFKFVYSRVGFADDVTNEMFWAVPSPGDPPCAYDRGNEDGLATPENPNTWRTTFEDGQDTDWSSPNISNVCQFGAISSGREIPNN